MNKITALALTVVIALSAYLAVNAVTSENGEADRLEKDVIYTSSDGLYQYKPAVYHTYEDCLVDSSYVSDTDVQIVKYLRTKVKGIYIVPDKIDGHPVGEIGKEAFKNRDFIKVEFHKNIKQVNSKAFYGCKSLKQIVFKGSKKYEGLSYVGKEAFANCTKLSKLRFNKNNGIIFRKKALYNCPKLKYFSFDSDCNIGSKAVGYYKDSETGKDKLIKGLKIKLNGTSFTADANTESYFYSKGYSWTADICDEDGVLGIYQEGYTYKLTYNGEKPKRIKSSNTKVVKVNSDGRLFNLKTGKSKLTFTMEDDSKKEYKLEVGNLSVYADSFPDVVYRLKKYNLYYNYDNDKGNSCPEYLPVKLGKVISLRIKGKVKSINNIYKSSAKAKIISSPKANILKIKGLQKGKTSVKIRINKIKTIKIKLKVK